MRESLRCVITCVCVRRKGCFLCTEPVQLQNQQTNARLLGVDLNTTLRYKGIHEMMMMMTLKRRSTSTSEDKKKEEKKKNIT